MTDEVAATESNEPRPLDFKVFGEPLNMLLIAVGNKLSREWPARYSGIPGARELFIIHMRVAHMSYRSAFYLGGDMPADPRRLPGFAVSLPLLNRSILESLFTVLFALEDMPARIVLFREADYREAKLEFDRYQSEYGGLPEWETYLAEFSIAVQMGLALTNLSPTEAANPRSLRAWPTPGQMTTYRVSPTVAPTPVREFMKYLNDFFYIDLSQQAHLGGWGIAKRGGYLIDEIQNLPDTEAKVAHFRHSQLGQSIALVLALASEIDLHFDFGLRQELLYVWSAAAPVVAIVEEVYKKRYRALLT